jgi:hypothetical protein
MHSLIESIKAFWKAFTNIPKSKVVDTLEWEASELEHLFALLTIGSFTGIPSPPMQITLDLLPELEKEFSILMNKIDRARSPLSDLFSVVDVS